MKDKKLLFIDTETTGMDISRHGIIQVSAIAVINNEPVDSFDVKCNIPSGYDIEEEAVSKHGYTREDIEKFISNKEAQNIFERWLDKHIDKYDSKDKFYPCGYNVQFDLNFLSEWFKIHSSGFLGSYLNWKRIDVLEILYLLELKGKLNFENFKLETVCKHFGIELKAHDALEDIYATYEIFKMVMK